ncbi:MAG: ParB N-terminal domain-containing protein [Planctomycetes bacterium]|nr:ParB N-terminal domain-containing protein [Planctomycetota bacterium]
MQNLYGVENARSASGPTPPYEPEFRRFQYVVGALRYLQVELQKADEDGTEKARVEVGYETKEKPLSGPIPPDQIKPSDYLAAADAGWKLQPEHKEAEINISEIVLNDEEPPPDYSQDAIESLVIDIRKNGLRRRIHVRWDSNKKKYIVIDGVRRFLACKNTPLEKIPCIVVDPEKYVLTGEEQILIVKWDPESSFVKEKKHPTRQALMKLPYVNLESGKYELELEPRSLMGVMYFLSHGVEIPLEHSNTGIVTTSETPTGESFDWSLVTGDLFDVCYQKKKPKCAAVAVFYRGYWYYIADTDVSSKLTFTLLLQLFELQAGGGTQSTAPLLTLPISR